MGAYSSWPLMALTHHAIVKTAGAKNYALLGDDIVIVGKRAALRYRQIMQDLGVEINLSKSIVPPTRTRGVYRPTVAEFAKRLFQDGVEVTPVPSKLIKNLPRELSIIEMAQWVNRTYGDRDHESPLQVESEFSDPSPDPKKLLKFLEFMIRDEKRRCLIHDFVTCPLYGLTAW